MIEAKSAPLVEGFVLVVEHTGGDIVDEEQRWGDPEVERSEGVVMEDLDEETYSEDAWV